MADRVVRRSAPGCGNGMTDNHNMLHNRSCKFEKTIIQTFYKAAEEENTEDLMFLHILDCIGCIGELTRDMDANSLTKSKRNIFWKAVREIADLELKYIIQREEEMEIEKKDLPTSAISRLLEYFPDNCKVHDGRSWMPFYWAVSLPNIAFEDIHNLIVTVTVLREEDGDENSVVLVGNSPPNLAHLACMANISVDVLHLLREHFPRLVDSIAEDYYNYTTLHFAVKYSNLAWVRELILLYPSMVEISDDYGCIPLLLLFQDINDSLLAQQILGELLKAAPYIARTIQRVNVYNVDNIMVSHSWLPLFFLLHYCNQCGNSSSGVLQMLTILLSAYPDALKIPDDNGCLPIHIAAARSPVHVLKLIAEESLDNISALTNNGLSVVHMAVRGLKVENLRYIFSIEPKLILVKDSKGSLAISHLIAGLKDDIYNSENDFNHNQHWYMDHDFASPFSNRSELLWFLLEIWSSIANKLATNQGQISDEFRVNQDQISEEFKYVYSFLSSSTNSYLDYPRRRLLANFPNLYEPEILRELNYSARRGALFIFFHGHFTSETNTIFATIKNGPGSKELIQSIISFL